MCFYQTVKLVAASVSKLGSIHTQESALTLVSTLTLTLRTNTLISHQASRSTLISNIRQRNFHQLVRMGRQCPGPRKNHKVHASPVLESAWSSIFYQLVGFECPHNPWLSSPVKLHSFLGKKMIHRSPPPSQNLGAKSQKEPPRWL